jgi:hypothetical protein
MKGALCRLLTFLLAPCMHQRRKGTQLVFVGDTRYITFDLRTAGCFEIKDSWLLGLNWCASTCLMICLLVCQ